MHCTACGLITTEISPHVGRNTPVSASGFHANEMMPQCLQNELDLGSDWPTKPTRSLSTSLFKDQNETSGNVTLTLERQI